MGLFTAIIGIQMSFDTQQPLVIAGALLIGSLLGEWWQIEDRLRNLGAWLEERLSKGRSRQAANTEVVSNNHGSSFVRGFLAASLVFAIGPIAILGSIQDGLTGDYSLLAIKSILDAFGALAFASSMGVGVLFSSLVILVYQGRHQPGRHPGPGAALHRHDGRDDGYRRSAAVGFSHQQSTGNQAHPGGQFPAGPDRRPDYRGDPDRPGNSIELIGSYSAPGKIQVRKSYL